MAPAYELRGEMRRIASDEKGQAFPLALIALAAGFLLITSFLSGVSTNVLASQKFRESTVEQYAADAGVEDAIWKVAYDGAVIPPGNTLSYSLDDPVNGITPSISITRVSVSLATDDFESGNLSGGSGWLNNWADTGDVKVWKQDAPHGGTYHLRMRKANSYLERDTDFAGQSGLHLQLWAKVDSLEDADFVEALVSPDHTSWNVVKTWTAADSDNTYHFVDIDLSPFTMSSQFWIAFNSGMNSPNDHFYIDDLLVGPALYEIVSSAGGTTVLASVNVLAGDVSVLTWQRN